MTTISPLIMRESTSVNFTVNDSNSGSNFYYSFTLSGNIYGQLISFNGLNKTFIFKSNSGIDFGATGTSVDQTISYDVYDDYPVLSNLVSSNNLITFTIF